MRINWIVMAMAMAVLTAAGVSCRSSNPDEITAADKLTQEEIGLMIAHVRLFVQDEAKKFKLKPEDIVTIRSEQPKVRVFYAGHKCGRLSLGWELKDRRFFAILEGDFMECKAWRIMINKNDNVVYYNRNSKRPDGVSIKDEFEELRNK